MKTYSRPLLFALVMALYLAFPAYMIYQQEEVLSSGEVFRFRLQPVDPYDPFRGRYLALNYNFSPLPAPAEVQSGDPLFATIETDSAGFAYLGRALRRPPEDEQTYLRTRAQYIDSNMVYIDFPDNMSRYYLNEKMAPAAEKALQELLWALDSLPEGRTPPYVSVRVKNGTAVIEELYLDGKAVGKREFLNR